MTAPANTPRLTKLKDCRHGRMLFLQTDMYIGASLDLYGEYSEGEGDLFAQLVRPGGVVVEVGANIGAHTLLLSKLVGDAGRVYAFEPQHLVFQILCANIALNEAFNVKAVNAGCGRHRETLKVPRIDYRAPGSNFGGVTLLTEEGDDIDVQVLDALPLRAMTLLKIDVEGMEAAVLEGAARHIARFRPAIYVENDRREHSAALISLLQSYGYDMWWHMPYLYNASNYCGVAENIFGTIASINMICLPREGKNEVAGFRRVTSPESWWTDAPTA